MDKYKKEIEKFLGNVEKLDSNCNFDNMDDRNIYLLNVIRACRNKLVEVYNCIGDTDWVLPNLEW